MLDVFAHPLAEDVENDLTDNEEKDSKGNMAQWPPILQRIHHENHLHHHINQQLHPIDQVQDDKQPRRVPRPQSRPPLKGKQTDGKGNDQHSQTRQPQQPDRQRRPILIELKADKPIDQQTRTQRTRQPILKSGKVGIETGGTGSDHPRIKDQTEDGQEHVDVEEGGDLLAADGGELAAHVQHHDDGHGQREDVHRVGRALEDDRVG